MYKKQGVCARAGINIENADIEAMFVDAHAGTDVVQMAGRVLGGWMCCTAPCISAQNEI